MDFHFKARPPPPDTPPAGTSTLASQHREPTVVVVNNALQKNVASPQLSPKNSLNYRGPNSGETSRSQTSTKSQSQRNSVAGESSTLVGSGPGTGPGSSSGTAGAAAAARLVFVNERSGSLHSSQTERASSNGNSASEKTIKPRKMQRDDTTPSPSNLPPRPPPPSSLLHTSKHSKGHHLDPHHQRQHADLSFGERDLKHHSFLSEDVRHMEKALLGLLDDFHSGKLRAFGSGTMEQMTDIREQQERLAKLHFELGGAVHNMMMSEGGEESRESGGGGGGAGSSENAQENMTRLVKQLELLSVSIEGLHSDAL